MFFPDAIRGPVTGCPRTPAGIRLSHVRFTDQEAESTAACQCEQASSGGMKKVQGVALLALASRAIPVIGAAAILVGVVGGLFNISAGYPPESGIFLGLAAVLTGWLPIVVGVMPWVWARDEIRAQRRREEGRELPRPREVPGWGLDRLAVEESLADEEWEAFRLRRWRRRQDGQQVLCLLVVALVAFVIAMLASYNVAHDVQQRGFQPSDTAQVVAAVGALATGIGTLVAGTIKAIALLIHARADMERARAGLQRAQPQEPAAEPEAGGDGTSGQGQ
ncbi:hypothetical protein [Streptomyces parvus]|uniref:Uncharacterized protein n=1 Tax=Streptomyces parvus TaxID=66428 RepID=A0A7K3S7P0_9ACTN|nr:hypothetical protein [Streptomyces parvus]NEC23526.1 hypothetical protein [Streptomyces parvus]